MQLKGCSFHWTQALRRKVGSYLKILNNYSLQFQNSRKKSSIIILRWQLDLFLHLTNRILSFSFLFQVKEIGLQDAYRNDSSTNQLIKQLMALPDLPAEKIKRDSLDYSSKQLSDPCRISAARGSAGSAARASCHRLEVCSWKPSRPTMT